jgi:parallel beta-helix repeat protein
MNRRLILFLIIASMVIAVLTVSPHLVKAGPRVWVVDDDGSADFHNIRDAINAASGGDTISVKAGTYNESYIEVLKALKLCGENASTTIVDGQGVVGAVFAVKVSYVNLCGFTIRNGAWGTPGVYIGIASECTVEDNIISSDSGYAIDLYLSNLNNISDNILMSSEKGIRLYGSSNNTIDNNAISNNGDGLYLTYESENNTFRDNTIEDNTGHGVYCQSFYGDKPCDNNVLTRNTIINNSIGIRLEYCNCTVIIHNNFISNTNQVLLQETSNSSLDDGYPFGGNYWSDYGSRYPDATEIDSSGLWNTPYELYGNNVDHYPLVNPIPEYYTLPALSLFMITALLAVIVYRKKEAKISWTR